MTKESIREAIIRSMTNNLIGMMDSTEELGDNQVQYVAISRGRDSEYSCYVIWNDNTSDIFRINTIIHDGLRRALNIPHCMGHVVFVETCDKCNTARDNYRQRNRNNAGRLDLSKGITLPRCASHATPDMKCVACTSPGFTESA